VVDDHADDAQAAQEVDAQVAAAVGGRALSRRCCLGRTRVGARYDGHDLSQ
jgi:hypothetical protein